MYRYPSKLSDLVVKYLDIISLLAMLILSIAHGFIKPGFYDWIRAITTIIVANIVFLYRRVIAYSYCILGLTIVFFLHSVGTSIGYSSLDALFLDPVLLLVVLTLITIYWDSADIGSVLARPLLPVSALISGLVATYMEVCCPARYLLLTVMDVTCSIVISKTSYSRTSMFIRGLLFFFVIYSLPGLSLEVYTLLAFTVLHVFRNIVLFVRKPSFLARRVTEIACLDILLKPVLVSIA